MKDPTFFEHLKYLAKGDWSFHWWEWELDFGFHHCYSDGYHYSLNLKIFSIGVYY